MLRKIASVGGLTLVSRVLGFLREMLTAAILGAGPVADAFFVAFRAPNNFRALFAEGAFNAAFVPQFSGILMTEGRESAHRMAEEVMAVLVSLLLPLTLLFEVIMPWFMLVYAPGFSRDPAKFALAVEFTRITFPYLILISLVSLQGGVLNGLGHFSAWAMAPVLMNLCMISALLGLAPHMPTPGHALAWGTTAAGLLQWAYLAWGCRQKQMALTLRRPRWTPRVRRFLTVLGPATLTSGIVQINLFVDTLVASLLPTGSVSYLYYADRLNQLPLGVIGIAVGTVLLPELSRHLKGGDVAAAHHSQNRALEISLLLTLPAAAALAIAARPILTILFAHGRFSVAEAALSAQALTAYAAGLPAFVIVRSLTPAFYAREDTMTPFRITLVQMTVNIALKIILMGPLRHVGLALATSISMWLNVILLSIVLRRRGHLRLDDRMRRRLPRIIAATLGMSLVLAAGQGWLTDGLYTQALLRQAGALAVMVGSGAAVFGGLAVMLGLAKRG